jgi:hypothetical protein
MDRVSLRKRAFLLSIGAAGVEAYVLCSAYLLPGGDDGEDGGGGDVWPDEPTPTPPEVEREPDRELTYA